MPQANQMYMWILTGRATAPGAAGHDEEVKSVREWCAKYAKRWAGQIEIGKGGYVHWHLYVSLKTKDRKSGVINTAREAVRQEWDVRPVKDEKATREYCTKKDSRVAGPWQDSDAAAPEDIKELKLYPWQQHIVADVRAPVTAETRRLVNVVIDEAGAIGKSTLLRYLRWHKYADVIPPFSSMERMSGYVLSKGAHTAYCVDIPRAMPRKGQQEMWAGIEQIKSGYAMDWRYTARDATFTCPHMWVFTNARIKEKLMSGDRWRFWCVRDGRLVPADGNGAPRPAASDPGPGAGGEGALHTGDAATAARPPGAPVRHDGTVLADEAKTAGAQARDAATAPTKIN